MQQTTSTSAQSKQSAILEKDSTKLRLNVIIQWAMTNHMSTKLRLNVIIQWATTNHMLFRLLDATLDEDVKLLLLHLLFVLFVI